MSAALRAQEVRKRRREEEIGRDAFFRALISLMAATTSDTGGNSWLHSPAATSPATAAASAAADAAPLSAGVSDAVAAALHAPDLTCLKTAMTSDTCNEAWPEPSPCSNDSEGCGESWCPGECEAERW